MDTNENKYSKYNQYGDDDFSWQGKCLSEISNAQNIIISSPTGSGKTKVCMDYALQHSERPIIITAPTKVISNQRYRKLLESGYRVALETGDRKIIPENYDILCCTQEIYTNKYVNLENATLIIDEIHTISNNSERARAYIDGIHYSKARNIILCSATLGNMDKFKEEMDNVSGRSFKTYVNHSRPTSLFFKGDIPTASIKDALVVAFSRKNIKSILDDMCDLREWEYYKYDDDYDYDEAEEYDDDDYDKENDDNDYGEKNNNPYTEEEYKLWEKEKEKIDERREKIRDLAKIFNIENEEDVLRYVRWGIAGYYGALLPKEKEFIEKCFEEGLIDTVVGTDAVALGANFPIRQVVFAQLAKVYEGPISKNLFEQLAGRAGRKGYFDEGDVCYCSELSKRLGLEPIKSYDDYWGNERYKTAELFDELLEAPLEDINIILLPKIKDILLGKTTVEEEVDYISKYSTKEPDVENLSQDLSKTIDYIINEAFRKNAWEVFKELYKYEDGYEYEDYESEDNDVTHDDGYENRKRKYLEAKQQYENKLLALEEEFKENIARVYFEEFSAEKNCKIFTAIICGESPEDILRQYADPSRFYDMLQFRKYVRSLPKKYRKGLTKIDNLIREIDETAIDEDRGRISVKEIGQQLEGEHRLDSMNIMKVLKEQGEFTADIFGKEQKMEGEEHE